MIEGFANAECNMFVIISIAEDRYECLCGCVSSPYINNYDEASFLLKASSGISKKNKT